MKTSKKLQLEIKIIKNLKQQKEYFSYDDIKNLLEKEKINITQPLLKKYLHGFI